MKEYTVSVDITVSKNFYVEAESENEAREIVIQKMKSDPYYYAENYNSLVDWGIVETCEE